MKKLGMYQFIRRSWLMALLMLVALPAWSAPPTGCTINSLSGLSFGSYDVFSLTADTGTASFTVQNCSNGKSSYTAALSTGGGSYTSRTMTLVGGTEKLSYNLYTSSAYTTVWGDGTGSTSTVAGTGSTGASGGTTVTIYGRIPAGQDVSAGSYSDSLTLTITF